MDGRTTYSKLKNILKDLQGVITIHELRTLIIINVGSCERTIASCLKILSETGLIKDIGDCKFEIQ
jgi:hypothetical protein